MADGRLWLKDDRGRQFLLAKRYGPLWYPLTWHSVGWRNVVQGWLAWLLGDEAFAARLDTWLDDCIGNTVFSVEVE